MGFALENSKSTYDDLYPVTRHGTFYHDNNKEFEFALYGRN